MTHKPRGRVWRLALPIILANLTVPLLGAVDTAVIGDQSAAHIGAVAVGATIFSFLYWAFGFLRMSTTGFAAQAHGGGHANETVALLGRACLLAIGFGGALVLLQWPTIALALSLVAPSAEVEPLARNYALIRIWGAPAALANSVVVGWLVGQQRAGTAFAVQLVINGTNIALDVWLARGLNMDVSGVALATVIAQYLGLAVGAALIAHRARQIGAHWRWDTIRDRHALLGLLRVNRDIFVRTICVLLAVAMFTAQGARMGDLVLAANGILLLFQSFMSYGLDGFAHAAEALVGAAYGKGDRRAFRTAVVASTRLAVMVAGGYTVLYGLFGVSLISLITNLPDVKDETARYLPWLVASPLVSVWAFQFDGIFIGATRAAHMRNAMVLSFVIFIALMLWLVPVWSNHGLWLAFTLFMSARGITLGAYYPALERSVANPR